MVIYFLLCCVCGSLFIWNEVNFLLKMLNCIALYFSLMLMWECLRPLLLPMEQGFYLKMSAKGEGCFIEIIFTMFACIFTSQLQTVFLCCPATSGLIPLSTHPPSQLKGGLLCLIKPTLSAQTISWTIFRGTALITLGCKAFVRFVVTTLYVLRACMWWCHFFSMGVFGWRQCLIKIRHYIIF